MPLSTLWLLAAAAGIQHLLAVEGPVAAVVLAAISHLASRQAVGLLIRLRLALVGLVMGRAPTQALPGLLPQQGEERLPRRVVPVAVRKERRIPILLFLGRPLEHLDKGIPVAVETQLKMGLCPVVEGVEALLLVGVRAAYLGLLGMGVQADPVAHGLMALHTLVAVVGALLVFTARAEHQVPV